MRASLLLISACLFFAGCDCVGDTSPDAGHPRDASASDGGLDAAFADAATIADAGSPDAGADAGCLSTACAATERCYDGLDNDCDGVVDQGCACVPGSTARCLPSLTDPELALCGWGEMQCEGAAEFGTWGPCVGAAGGDAGMASPYGCRRIGIMGAPGANPSANFQAWLETQGAIATRFHATAGAPSLQRAELETFDLVIVDWLQRLYAVEESDTLASWVRDGGALMVMTGHDSGATADRHVSLLASLGPSFDLAAGPLNGPAMLLPHPTTVTADGASTLPPVTFAGGLRTVVPAALAADVVPMASIGDQIVGVAGPLGMGQVLLFGDEWIEFDSEWSTMPPIVQLWLNTVRWLSPDRSLGIPICE
jgi:hypothetical protein